MWFLFWLLSMERYLGRETPNPIINTGAKEAINLRPIVYSEKPNVSNFNAINLKRITPITISAISDTNVNK